MEKVGYFNIIVKQFYLYNSFLWAVCLCYFNSNAQSCPPNIDFETGTFNGWTCFTGSTAEVNGQNVITLFESGPVSGRHTMYTASLATELDYYGNFPVLCPNGSKHSIRLGNNLPGTEAEGISYEFTIPANRDYYTLIYHYAVVFQDPDHTQIQKPRMEIEINNVSDNKIIDCSSFTFIPNGSQLPGFFESPIHQDNTPIWCKNWTAVSINLDGNAGKTIRLTFKTADCTFRRHFGYAYIDINSECSSEIEGATYCPDDTAVQVTAPYGYQTYTWFNNNFTQVLGNQQTIIFSPPPLLGTNIAVQIVPYDGYGCIDTLYARLLDTLTVKANAGKDNISCNNNPVQIGANPKSGLVYSWSPTAGLNNSFIANPYANPAITTSYYLTTSSIGGGCANIDTVIVRSSILDSSMQLKGKAFYCEGYGDSSILKVAFADSIQWFKNDVAIPGANQTEYKATKTGFYHAILFSQDGCSIITSKQEILIDKAKAGITYPLQYAVIDLPLPLQARQFGSTAIWSPGTYLNNPESYTPVFKGTNDQLYTIEIKTNSGCVTTDRQIIKIVPRIEIYVPTAFTPNNDGLNDFLHPSLMGIKELSYFRIFNRWGQLLFETKNELPGWDGKINGQLQSTQVFVWMAEGIGLDNNVYRRKGTVTLVR